MMGEGYTTPEGFWLPKPLLLPEARTFSDVLDYCGEWDHATMTGRSGNAPAADVPAPRYIPTETPDASPWEREAWHTEHGRNEIGPFCTVDLRQLGGAAHRSMAVRATDAVIDAVAPRIVTPDDHLSFRLIGHEGRGRVLVILQHGYIIGSHWLAYIDPETIPPYPYAERDRRAAEVRGALQAEGFRVIGTDAGEPHALAYRAEGSPLRAVIHADASITRTWQDGTVSHEQ